MSRIGTIDKLNIANVLQRIETFAKTGLLVVKQDTRWVEFYCREGRLLCVGPIRTDATLGERLLQDGVITIQELQETMLVIGNAVPSETRIALTLMDLGFVTREELREWTGKKTQAVLSAVLSWCTGELDFDEDGNAPSERLLVSLSITDLLTALPSKNALSQVTPITQSADLEPPALMSSHTNSAESDVSHVATLHDSTQFFPKSSSLRTPATAVSSETLLPVFPNEVNTDSIKPFVRSQTPPPLPRVVSTTTPSPKISTQVSWQPDMVLIPADLSAMQEQYIQVTPDQWRLLTRIDGLTSLQDTSVALKMHPQDVCRVAGELLDERIVHVAYPSGNEVQELLPPPQHLLPSGLSDGLATPGYVSTVQSPWSAMPPRSDITSQPSFIQETDSQWGNGGKTFIPKQGWVSLTQSPMPPNVSSSGGVYTSVSSRR